MSDEIIDLAEQYLQACEEAESREEDVDILREEREKWKSKMKDLDEDDPLYDVAEQNVEERDEQIERIRRSREQRSKLETELLERTASGFVPQGDWTAQEVLRGLNLALLGIDRDYIEINTTRIEEESNVKDDDEMFEIAMSIRDVAKEGLQESTKLSDFWSGFIDLQRFELFEEVLRAEEPLSGSEIAKRRDEEENRHTISQALINTTNGEVNPYYKQGKGKYSLSFVGEYLVWTFGDGELNNKEKSNGSGEASLNEFQ